MTAPAQTAIPINPDQLSVSPNMRNAHSMVTGGVRFGITMARANWRAVKPATACSISPSRR